MRHFRMKNSKSAFDSQQNNLYISHWSMQGVTNVGFRHVLL